MEIKRGNCFLCVAFAFVMMAPAAFLGGLTNALAEEESSGTWTVALYVDADCNLEMYWEDPSLPYLLNIPESPGLNVVAIIDWLTDPGVEMVEISGGDEPRTVKTYDEMNFGAGETFEWFLKEIDTYYPADHLVVIPWDHGSAWKGFCWDDTDGDHITLQEMEAAIIAAGIYIDILAFDACSCSSIEMAYSAARTGLVELLVASEELVAGDGFPYDLMFTPVALDPSRTPDQVAVDMVDGWIASYEPLPWAWYCTLGVVDVKEIADSLDVISDWVAQMTEGMPAYKYNYRMALRDSYYVSCGSHYQVDMVDLGRHLLADKGLKGDAELMATTRAMVDLIEGAVKYVYNTETTEACGGVSIYWGSHNQAWRTSMSDYCEVPFADESGWADFVVLYNTLTCGWMRITK